jgi:hypothetical protein
VLDVKWCLCDLCDLILFDNLFAGSKLSKVAITVIHEIGHIYHSVLVDYASPRNRYILGKGNATRMEFVFVIIPLI